ncbi:amidohydrolase family protein [Dictyobacter arantiisoli]|uniref:Amidohydrolase n=1 Tax=Dictyobacter arantiisoli TaxID=2014874 RepID=A0A5A5TE21_9CHLR|nr:amidohydrolase family protein [Dictyobacter arantiisoli]GCF09475.1 amidohydrolase [Dictyobacter arantiisoli]
MPDFPILDAHVHLWDPEHFRIPWLDDTELLNRRYGLQEYQQYTQGVSVEGMVYVEVDVDPHYALAEAKWAAEQAAKDSRLLGIVAHAPLEFGERVRAYLDTLVQISPLIKGVRRLLQSEADSAYGLRPDFVRGVQLLAEYQLSFDICVRHGQLSSMVELVCACPETTFILDHIGKPDIQGHILEPWYDDIKALAAFSNVVCKISGLVTEADHEHWQIEDLAPYVSHVIASFGEDRVLFGGDWPVVLETTSYPRWVEALDVVTADLSVVAKRKLWNENARHVYLL